MTLILPFFNSQNKKVLTASAPADPIQVLVDEYQSAAAAKGYDYLGDDTALYAKYEELVLANKLTEHIYMASPKYACKINSGNVTHGLSLIKINGDYPEFVSIGAVSYNSEYFRFKRTQMYCTFLQDYDRSSIRIKYKGSVDIESSINTRIWSFTKTSLRPVYYRKLSDTQCRWAFYNNAGSLLPSTRSLNHTTDDNHISEQFYMRTGNAGLMSVYKDGTLIGTDDFPIENWDTLINGEGIRIAGSFTAIANININEFEIELYRDNF